MLLAFQLEGVATAPLKVTVLAPCELPRFDPLIVTVVPTGPDIGEIPETMGTTTVKLTPLLGAPPTVTTTGPVVAATGTGTVILVVLQFVGVAVTPLKVTVLVPWLPPKFDPVRVTEVPGDPDVADKPEIVEVISFQ
jgi:hypothetical protein